MSKSTIHSANESVSDWKTALKYLKDGNERYLENRTIIGKNGAKTGEILKNGQKPFAVVVTCSDSRVAPEIYFDQNLGDIFVIRNAGNIAGNTVFGTIEFAVEFVGIPFIAVVGHSDCRAVISAFGGKEFSGNLRKIMEKISPAVNGCQSVQQAIRANVRNVVGQIRENDVVKRYGVKAAGAYYDIESGTVEFFDL